MDTDTNERSRSSVLGMRVISISEGLELGRIRQAVVTQEPRDTCLLICLILAS